MGRAHLAQTAPLRQAPLRQAPNSGVEGPAEHVPAGVKGAQAERHDARHVRPQLSGTGAGDLPGDS